MRPEKVFAIKFSGLYPLYVKKAEAKGRSKDFAQAPHFNPSASLIKGVVCGVRVEDVEHPLMRKIRYMDKLVDELAKGKGMDKILRK